MSELSVEKIMEEIRSEIEAKGYTNCMLSFNDITSEDVGINIEKFERVKFNEELFNLNTSWNINPNREIPNEPGLKGKCATLIMKIIRKCISFYLSPIVWEQDAFNATTVRLFNMLNLYMEENTKLSEEVHRLKDEQAILLKRVNQFYDLRYKGE